MASAAPSPPALEQMAVGNYHEIVLFQNSNKRMPWPNLYVSVNGYQVVLPREKPVVIADAVLAEITAAAEGYEHEVQDPTQPDQLVTVRKRRQDLHHRVMRMGISPGEADEMRQDGKEVYPKKLSAGARSALKDLRKKSK